MKVLGHFLWTFKYEGAFTSPSNEAFDRQLKEGDPQSGIRSFEDINNAMIKNGFELVQDIDMPPITRCLFFQG